jgi:hypothetical protein
MLLINRTVELKSSIEWIKSSFSTLREKPLQFIVLGIFSTLIGLLPIFGAFMGPLFIARFARLTQKVENNEPILFSTLFDDFFANKMVVKLAFVNFFITSAIFIAQYFVEGVLKQRGIDVSSPGSIIMLIFFLPVLLLQVAMWLSPLICLYNEDITPFQAMWLSIKATGFNIATMLIYTVLVIFFTLLAIIPLGLGLLIWLPMLNIVTYFIYKSLFIS